MVAAWQAELERDGACVVPSVLGREEIKSLLAELDIGGADVSRRGKAFAKRNILKIAAVRDAANLPAVRAIVSAALGGSFQVVRGILFDKTPAANWTVPWHQDRSIAVKEKRDVPGYGPWSSKAGIVHVQPPIAVLQQMVTVRVHLDNCGPDDGPLRIVAGTHETLLDAAEVNRAVAAGESKPLTGPAGSAVVMRPLVLHASSPAKLPSHRRVLHLEFAAGDLSHGLAWAFG